MHLIHTAQLSANHAGRTIFTDLTFAIDARARIGLVGPNGAGKSTLLRLLAGELRPESGQIMRYGDVHTGYLPQDIHLPPELTLLEAALLPLPRLAAAEARLSEVEARLGDPAVYENEDALAAALAQHERHLAAYERLNGPRHAAQVRKLLAALGFSEADYALPAATLSGGQKKLVALARLATLAPDLLLLDEPDNHLDLHGKRFLERFIQAYPGAVVIVSHDRYLLDEVATQIFELEQGRVVVYPGNYSAYITERALRRLRQQQAYVAQQKEIARIEAAIARFEHWASIVVDERHIRQARSRRKMLDRMEDRGEIIEKVVDSRRLELDLGGGRGSTLAVEMKHVAALVGEDNLLFTDVDFTLRHGERVGIVGPNGAGKSVFMRLILGELEPFAGVVRTGAGSFFGHYSQEHQTLAPWLDQTPLDLIRRHKIGGEGEAVSFLLKLLFKYEQVRQPIRTLSGGERSRLQLALLMLQRPNALLLDEPTNNLDIASVEALEAALEDFEGAVLVVSHDRYFLDQVVDRVVELRDGRAREYLGGYTDYAASAGLL